MINSGVWEPWELAAGELRNPTLLVPAFPIMDVFRLLLRSVGCERLAPYFSGYVFILLSVRLEERFTP